jgi:hypothetical protein
MAMFGHEISHFAIVVSRLSKRHAANKASAWCTVLRERDGTAERPNASNIVAGQKHEKDTRRRKRWGCKRLSLWRILTAFREDIFFLLKGTYHYYHITYDDQQPSLLSTCPGASSAIPVPLLVHGQTGYRQAAASNGLRYQ